MGSKRFVAPGAALAIFSMAHPGTAQTVAYLNLLQFDLQSFRSQATGGIFHDDVDYVGNAARLLQVDGTRLYTNFSNLNGNATLGDPILTYSRDAVGNPTTEAHFGTGSFLIGWIGRLSADSDYTFSAFVQRNGGRMMFEDLEDGLITGGVPSNGPGTGSTLDAEFDGTTISSTFDPDANTLLTRETTSIDLKNYDDRSASNYDFGIARPLNERFDLGGRIFYKKDELDRKTGGATTVAFDSLDAAGDLVPVRGSTTTYGGDGEGAFRYSELGISLNTDYHAWATQSFNLRLDVFRTKLTNPAMGLSTPTSRDAHLEDPTGNSVDSAERVTTRQVGGTLGGGLGPLAMERTNSTTIIADRSYFEAPGGAIPKGTTSVEDERTGVGVNLLVEYDREWARGDTRTWVGFARKPFDIQATVVSRALEQNAFWWNDGGGDRLAIETLRDDRETIRRNGDMKVTTLEAGTRYWREISRRVNVGLGLVLTRSTWREEYEQSVDTVSRTAFDDGDQSVDVLETSGLPGAGAGAFSEGVTTTSSVANGEVDDELRNTVIRIPVGTQFRFGNWTWNMGLTHEIIDATRETSVVQGDSRATTIVEDLAAGTTTTTYETTGATNDGTVTDRNKWNQTTYWYGLEWLFTDSAQINVNGFFDTHSKEAGAAGTNETQIIDVDFFRNLAVSITFLFN